jgi:hypothetical protein
MRWRGTASASKAFCGSLSADELATQVPDAPWTVHTYIAHLCTIDALLVRFFGPMVGVTDTPPVEVAPPVPFDIDEWNEAIVQRRTARSVDELFAEGKGHRENYERCLGAIPDDRLEMMIPFGGDRKVIDLPTTTVRLWDLLTSIALHDPNHTRDIMRALPHREPDVHDWLASVDFGRVPTAINDRRA